MDEPEVIPRREALLGLGLLGLTTVALVGTVVFRIVQEAPPRTPQAPVTVWASQTPAKPLVEATTAAAEVESGPSEPRLAAEISPPAAPIPTIDDGAGSVPVSTNAIPADAALARPEAPVEEEIPAPALPYFVAPAGQ
jgi:hypothetical protein